MVFSSRLYALAPDMEISPCVITRPVNVISPIFRSLIVTFIANTPLESLRLFIKQLFAYYSRDYQQSPEGNVSST